MTFTNLKKNRQLTPATSTMLLILIPLLALQLPSPIGRVTAEMDNIIPNPARHRLHQRHRQKSNKKNHHHKKHHGRGTLFSFRRPTVDLASEWYATTEKDSYDDIMFHGDETAAAEELFNHDSVGMTNPCLHIDLTTPQPHTINNNINEVVNCGNTATMPQQQTHHSSTADDESNNAHDDLDKLWWPLTPMNEKIDGNGKRLGKNKSGTWRVLRYHRRVGKGQDCYERVRDAALDWSFGDNNSNGDGDERGIVRLNKTQKTKSRKKDSPKSLSSTARTTPILREEAHMGGVYNVVHNSFVTDGGFELSSESSKNIAQIWSGPQRKLVTFSATNLLGKLEDKLFSGQRRQRWKPKVYAVNPVMVVYDLVDQRGPGTTFTSTAYATMKGHLLSGECRQTVALRDGIDEEVDIEILSYCRPAPSFWGKVVWPFISPMQTKFFESHMDHLEHAAVAGGSDKVRNQHQHTTRRITNQ
mmetsp:Transcript_25056/g.35070  ORF Transcript_25056/g.35070 Transcript_25056/m.35070 type:complete len:472 (+) Transcript_25056:239-1654(+)